MVRKLMLVVDNGPLRSKNVTPIDLLGAYVNWCFALWGIHGR